MKILVFYVDKQYFNMVILFLRLRVRRELIIRRDGRAVEGTGLENRRCESIRGFESHSLRQLNFSIDLRKYPRGRRGSPAKGVGWIKPARGFKSLLPRHVKPCNLNGYRVFVYPLTLILTLYRFQRAFAAIVSTGDFLNKFLHAVSGLLPHFLRYMAVHIQGKAGGGMAQIGLHCLDVIAALNGGHGKAVP